MDNARHLFSISQKLIFEKDVYLLKPQEKTHLAFFGFRNDFAAVAINMIRAGLFLEAIHFLQQLKKELPPKFYNYMLTGSIRKDDVIDEPREISIEELRAILEGEIEVERIELKENLIHFFDPEQPLTDEDFNLYFEPPESARTPLNQSQSESPKQLLNLLKTNPALQSRLITLLKKNETLTPHFSQPKRLLKLSTDVKFEAIPFAIESSL